MTGIERITERIYEQSQANCEAILADAAAKVKEIIADARAKASEESDKILAQAKAEADASVAKAKSTAEAITRNRYLEIRNAILNDIISAAYLEIDKFSDEQYFDMIVKLVKNNMLSGECVMYMSGFDLARLPEGFEETVNLEVYEKGAIRISDKPVDIENGFILSFGKVEVNCTLRAVFDDCMDSLKDMLGIALF